MSNELFDKSKDNQIRQNGLIMDIDEIVDLLNSQSKLISAYMYEFSKIRKENEQLHYELEQIKEYLQIKIDECKNHKKMEEIAFGVEQAVGYEKALLQFQKGLKRRLNDE